jgi:S-(hydroxymethyl)glutathione dehydrogenase/alcohol dehydrogenase
MTVAKAAVIYDYGQAAVLEELEWDEPRWDEVAVRVLANGVCHSDWHATLPGPYNPTSHPIILGHEVGGIVEKIGPETKRVKVGDHVVMSWIASCGHCRWCSEGFTNLCDVGGDLMSGIRSDGTFRVHNKKGQGIHQLVFLGGYSEYIVSPENSVIVVDKDFDLHKICILGCRVPTGWGAAVKAAEVTPGSTALVVGLGGVGFSVLQGLKNAGAVVIIGADIHPWKKEKAMEFGVTHFIDASKQDVVEEVMEITGVGVDYAFDAYGDPKVQGQAVESLSKGGTAVFVGVSSAAYEKGFKFNGFGFTLLQKKIVGSCYGNCNPASAVSQLLKMYRAGIIKIDELITKEYKLDQVNEAWADMVAGKNIVGVIRMD